MLEDEREEASRVREEASSADREFPGIEPTAELTCFDLLMHDHWASTANQVSM